MRKTLLSMCLLTMICLFDGAKGHGSNLSFTGKYLYWLAQQRDLEFMRTWEEADVDFPGANSSCDQVHEPGYRWNSGFRVGLKYTMDEECCFCAFNPGLEYTHFWTNGKKRACAELDESEVFQGTPSLPPAIPPSTENFYINGVPTVSVGCSKIHLNVDYVDLTLFGNENCCDCLSWNWSFGARGAILKNRWRTDYLIQLLDDSSSDSDSSSNFELAPQRVRINWRYEGLGLLLNGGGACQLACGFRLYQNVAGALLLGKMKTYSKACIEPEFIGKVGICNISRSQYKIVPVIQSETGIDWVYFCESGYGVRINVAFEYSKWFDVAENHYYTIPQAARFKNSCVDIDLYGLTTGISFYY